MRRPTPSVVLLLILPAISAVCFHRLLATPGALIVDGRRASVDHADRGHSRGIGNDLTSVFLPRFLYIVRQGREHGKRPAWDASGFGGRPLVGNPQSGLNYPPVWFAWSSGQPGALGWLTVAHLLWGGLGVYVLTRSLDFGRAASVVAAGCFQASPYLIAQTFEGHYPHVWSACWYPWAFWSLERAGRREPIGYLALPAVLAFTFLTGHPQEWYYLVLALTVMTCVDGMIAFRNGRKREGFRRVFVWAGLLAVSLGLCAIEVLPELAVGPWLLKTSAIPLAQVNRYQLHPINLFQLLSPFALGRPHDYTGHENYWETVLAIGLAPLVLVVIGAALYGDRSVIQRWGALVAASLLFAGGRKLGLYALAYAVIPGMERFRVPSRSLFLASLGASVLAGAGMQTLVGRPWTPSDWVRFKTRSRAGLAVVGLFVIALGFVAATRPERTVSAPRFPENGGLRGQYEKVQVHIKPGEIAGSVVFWASLLGMLAVLSLAGRGRRAPVVAAWGLGALALVEVTVHAQSLIACAPVARFQQGEVADTTTEYSGPVRVASVGSCYPDLTAVAQGWEKTNVNDSFQVQHAADVYECLYPILEPAYLRDGRERPLDKAVEHFQCTLAQAVMDVMSTRYLVADRPIPLKSIERVHEDDRGEVDGVSVWKNRSALPRAYVVPRAVVQSGWEGATVARRLSEIDPRRGVLMSRDPLGEGPRQPFLPAEWVSHDPDVVTLRVVTIAPGLLVIGNTWMPDWRAEVDGISTPVLRGNHWQQVVPIPNAGRHEIIVRYEPPGLAAGKAISAAVGFAWAGIALVVICREVVARGFRRFLQETLRPSRAVFEGTIRA